MKLQNNMNIMLIYALIPIIAFELIGDLLYICSKKKEFFKIYDMVNLNNNFNQG